MPDQPPALCRVLIAAGGAEIFSYGGSSPAETIREIVSALKQLLSPAMGDSEPLYVGQARFQSLQ